MTVVGGDDIKGMTQQQMHENIIAGLRKAAPIAEKHKVTLILEPMNIRVDHKGHCLYGSEPTVRIIKAVGSKNVRINWDLYHMQISEGDLCGRLRDGYSALGYVQIADHPGRNEPGTGEIHYPRVLRQLHELGYRGLVGLELRPRKTELEAARAVNRADQW
jgi:hydroxypyruvate isomerase